MQLNEQFLIREGAFLNQICILVMNKYAASLLTQRRITKLQLSGKLTCLQILTATDRKFDLKILKGKKKILKGRISPEIVKLNVSYKYIIYLN